MCRVALAFTSLPVEVIITQRQTVLIAFRPPPHKLLPATRNVGRRMSRLSYSISLAPIHRDMLVSSYEERGTHRGASGLSMKE